MPELPEVETVKSGLQKLIVDRKIESVNCYWPKSLLISETEMDKFVIGASIINVDRRAKLLLIGLSSEHTLVVHLKMTGQIVFRGEENFGAGHPSDSLIGKLPDRSTRVIITFNDGSELFFNDQRKFGWIKLVKTLKIKDENFIKKLGPEPLAKNFSSKDFIACIRKRQNSNIKSVLLDQTVVSGIGNIYADESLWSSRIHPTARVNATTDGQLERLFSELQSVLNLSINMGGSTDKNYVNAEGKKGSYLDFAKVFRREGQSCLRCETTVVKIRVSSRGTHICPKCQTI
jgi:formamidopyrimidine-DNA glycosylase